MSTLEELDDQALLDLARRTDPLGVLAVYATVEPGEDRKAVAIDLNNRYRELQSRMGEEGSTKPTAAALERLRPQVDRLTSPTQPGRGRIAFLALSTDWELWLTSQLPVPCRVVLDDGPFIHPLLELLDEGQPAGVVLVSAREVQLLEWRLGDLQPVSTVAQEYIEAPHERSGPLRGGAPGQFSTPANEQRQDRAEDRARRFLTQAANDVTEAAGKRGWQRILISGGEPWGNVLAAQLPVPLQDAVVPDPRILTGLDEPAQRRAITDRLHDDHLQRERRLAESVRDAGLSQAGALGLSEVTAALNEGRVTHLVYDPQVRFVGSVTDDGLLWADDESAAGSGSGSPEPRLTERLVERALTTGARVTPVEGAAADALREAGGIGAVLRW